MSDVIYGLTKINEEVLNEYQTMLYAGAIKLKYNLQFLNVTNS